MATATDKSQDEQERSSQLDIQATRTTASADAEVSTLAEEPRPDNAQPLDAEKAHKHQPGGSWKQHETHEIPHK